ncbi:MAG TPA: hypothetical protein VL687_05150 [Methylomirabilota bacterium]|jgi:hypothetical protein|nr:hypothetical protein [Methylomirabilota bacterium]
MDDIKAPSRRTILAGAGGAVVAMFAQAVGRPQQAGAATGDPLVLGHTDNATPDSTTLTYTSPAPLPGNALSVESNGNALFCHTSAGGTNNAGVDAVGSGQSIGVRGGSNQGHGVVGLSSAVNSGAGVIGVGSGGRTGVAGIAGPQSDASDAVTPSSTGVWGRSNQTASSRGVFGESAAGTGVQGTSPSGKGVLGTTTTGTAVRAISDSGSAVSATSTGGTAVLGVSANGKGGWLSNSSSTEPGLLVHAKGLTTAIEGYSGAAATPPAQKPQTGVFGYANTSANSAGVIGETRQGAGVVGFAGPPSNAASDRSLTGVYGYGEGSTDTIAAAGVWGDTADGYGVIGTGPGGVLASGGAYGAVAVSGTTGVGLYAHAGASNGPTSVPGTGVLASAEGLAPALDVRGVARFSRSGAKTITSGSSTTVTGVALATSTLVFAQLQTNRSGVWVRSVVTNPASSSFTIYLNTSVSASTKLAWFAIG